MKKGLKILIIALLIVAGLSFCVRAAKQITNDSGVLSIRLPGISESFSTPAGLNTVTHNLGEMEFRAIEVSNATVVTVRDRADENRDVILQVEERLAEYVNLKVVKGVLHISLKNKSGRDRNLHVGSRLHVSVPHCEGLNSLSASAASRIETTSAVQADKVTIEANGASKVITEVDCRMCSAEASGASRIVLSGQCEKLEAEASGASSVDAEECESEVCDAEASGASKVTVWCSDLLTAEASGASKVCYKGDCARKTHTSGASSIRKIK